jgi:thiol-disulfide isomerase/thioredoxin
MLRNRSVLLCLAGALVIALVVICFLVFRSNGSSKPKVEPMQHQPVERVLQRPSPVPQPSQAPSSGPALVLFYAEWCGHSKNMTPAWKQASESLKSQGLNVIEFEHGKDGEEMQKHGVKGFPSLRFYPEGFPSSNFVEYKGDRSAESIIKFAQTGGSQT